MQGLFIIGNKRSGSSHLMRLLNLHPEIYISKESDVLWILSRFHEEKHFDTYPGDSPKGMLHSLRTAGHKLSHDRTVKENFIAFQKCLMREGFLSLRPMDKRNLTFIGDQKPYQNADPELLPFLLEHIPAPKFIHLYRHPFEVIRSAQRFHHGTGGYIWGGMNAKEIFDEWIQYETRVREVRKTHDLDSIDIEYNDLIGHTEHTMASVFQFLGLEYDNALLWNCRLRTKPNFRRRNNYAIRTARHGEVMEDLGFKKRFNYLERRLVPRIKRRLLILYIGLKKRLEEWIGT